ncbi:peptide-methionine (R)-S-oxide reductase MsrB [Novosphingobium pentaromativorans]|uniref:peptide-methionine (R)-S-oxide reductase MsrB n=1 Tax=Novosphingobium pentaromativorans TaxID=205844 RepID=UPI0002F6E7C7|nr:peptide-methionine (R)-S-oxide reductase MsrB [Novosphingobium pentaromativorans]AIT80200.1 methionine sulfoxide reductase B [Novosphingobium pentaromativorans US6-1]
MPLATSRRRLLAWLGVGAALPVLTACGSDDAEAKAYPVSYSEAEWRKRLTREQFHILREAGTERPYSSPLNDEHRKGTFVCAADGNPLFSSATKFDSGTGWPSFWKPLAGAVGTSTDYKLGYPRTEVHCAKCGGHLGHVFDDGPKPTGKRYCMNGAAMKFRPA